MKESENYKEVFDYLILVQRIFQQKKILVLFSGVGLMLGLILIFSTQKEYQSSSFVIVESGQNSSSQFGQMGALAGFAGISMPSMQGENLQLSSDLFPEVIHSRDFLLQLMKERFFFESKGKEMSLEEFYIEEPPVNLLKGTIDFIFRIPSRIIGLFSSSLPEPKITEDTEIEKTKELDYVSVTSAEIRVMSLLKSRLSIEDKNELLEIKTSMPEPLISAKVNAMVLNRLIDYVTSYKTAKQKINLEFIKNRVKESEQKFQDAQTELAIFRDSNQGVISQLIRTKEEQLQFEFNISYNVYNNLKQELEQANIQLKRETPLFTIMEKAAIPLGPSKPNSPLIFVFSIFLGFFFGVLFSVFKILKSQLVETNA